MYDYSTSVPLHTIALLYIYSMIFRFMIFEYKVSANIWLLILKNLEERGIASDKKTIKKGELLIYTSNSDSSHYSYWKRLHNIVRVLISCPICKGIWSGYIIYFIYLLKFNNLHLDIRQVIDFALFSWSCGVASFFCSKYINLFK